jgi:serine/threonine protein kinase
VIADQGYDGKKADVWSIGVILYVLLAGFLPFDEGTIMALFSKIQKADFTYPTWFSPEVRTLLDQVLVADPTLRISLIQLKDHPWMIQYRLLGSKSSPTHAAVTNMVELGKARVKAFPPLPFTLSQTYILTPIS